MTRDRGLAVVEKSMAVVCISCLGRIYIKRRTVCASGNQFYRAAASLPVHLTSSDQTLLKQLPASQPASHPAIHPTDHHHLHKYLTMLPQHSLLALAISLFAPSALSVPTTDTLDPSSIVPIIMRAAPRPDRATLEAECGALGVMEVPEGEDPTLYRHCRDHPSMLDPTQTSPRFQLGSYDNVTTFDLHTEVGAQACLKNPGSRGCSKSYDLINWWCWRGCGTPSQLDAGYWCWLAWNQGKGDWVRCNVGGQPACHSAMQQGASCGVGNCNACGCGC